MTMTHDKRRRHENSVLNVEFGPGTVEGGLYRGRRCAIEWRHGDLPFSLDVRQVRWRCRWSHRRSRSRRRPRAGAGREAGIRPRRSAAVRRGGDQGHAAERADLLHPQEHASGEARDAAAGRQGRLGRRDRRSSRGWRTSSSTWRSTAASNFKPGELIKTLESTGARMGPHVNAYTSFDETVYMFQVPTDKDGIVGQGLQALADVGSGLTLDPKEIDKERGVVIEEWRGGLGAGARLRDQQIPVLYHGSKYAERLPIGKPEVLKSVHARRRCARSTRSGTGPTGWRVVVVGDIDPAAMRGAGQGDVRSDAEAGDAGAGAFLRRAAARRAAGRRSRPIPKRRSRRSRCCASARARPNGTVADYRRSLAEQMVYQMLNERFDELSRKKDAQFLGAGAYESPLSPSVVGLRARRRGRGREDPAGPVGARDRNEPRAAVRLRAGGARAREEVVARLLRARLQRARQERERNLRPGIRQPLPAGRTGARHRVRVPARAGADPGDHRRGGRERGEGAVRRYRRAW